MKNLLRLAVLGCLAMGSAQAATYHVTIPPGQFIYVTDIPVDPVTQQLTILRGDRVVFDASAMHPLRFVNNDFDAGGVGCDNNCSINFWDTAGSRVGYEFFCKNHPNTTMRGVIAVKQNPDWLFTGDFDNPVIYSEFYSE